MDKEKADDVQYVVTCTYCGAQTGLSIKQLEDNRPVKCPACGAALEIVPPPKRPAPKRKKRLSNYYLLHTERTEKEPRPDKKYRIAANVVGILYCASVVIAVILMWLIAKC